jgi:dipeptidyl aminopeptidase/acylaminoacyl peptidase
VDYPTARAKFKTMLTRIGPSSEPGDPPPEAIEGAVRVPYTSGGHTLAAFVNPEAKVAGAKRPAILLLHDGFAFIPEDWDDAAPFLDAGLHVMIPVLRGENGQPGAHTIFYDEVDDCLAAAGALANLPGVDPDKLYVAGYSDGGTLALLSALASDRFKACASFSGSPCPSHYEITRKYTVTPPFEPNEEELRMRSPIAFAAHFKCPVRAYVGDRRGEVFLASVTETMVKQAKAAGKDVEVIYVPGDHESMVGPASRGAVEFFRQNGAK